ncbi:MAG TPA: 16S rRNA (guanine(966)-N(2))-methyltransferase RsmD [Vicinamibacterales bacterium]|nr:16S rRNA (guanine(966)-N(2))-methyltransferase RsmD [Vicinamibacterales bacterium]
MRIIAGTLKGRNLAAPPGRDVRPTSDSLRETLFNVLGDLIVEARVLDAFAGTGAIGLEALSRGARQVTFIERDARAIRALSENIRSCGVPDACAIIRHDFLSARITGAFDLVIADPPYDMASLDETVTRGAGWLAEHGRLVLEHSKRRVAPETAGPLRRSRTLTAGDSALSFYERPAGAPFIEEA